jgi:hypothetical protein
VYNVSETSVIRKISTEADLLPADTDYLHTVLDDTEGQLWFVQLVPDGFIELIEMSCPPEASP